MYPDSEDRPPPGILLPLISHHRQNLSYQESRSAGSILCIASSLGAILLLILPLIIFLLLLRGLLTGARGGR